MRKIEYIVCHCTATSQDAKVETIINNWKKLGWKNVGYHYLIEANGKVHKLASHETITNGVKGFNSKSIHVSYIGGKDKDDRTNVQKLAMECILRDLKSLYPNAIIQGHRDFPNVAKSCPRFDAKVEYKGI
jgi:N-acetylmuramoyl-L-alanine amidase